MDIRKFMFRLLPSYFKANDTYKDADGRGLLERYLDTLGDELQEETIKKMENLIRYLDPSRDPENRRVFTWEFRRAFGIGYGSSTFNEVFDEHFGSAAEGSLIGYVDVFTEPFNEVFGSDIPIHVPSDSSPWLSLLAYMVGTPPYIIENEDVYRRQVTQAITLYKYKGTIKGFRLLFSLLGYQLKDVQVLNPPNYTYDSGITYDQQGVRYDLTKCNTHCIEYNLVYELRNEEDEPLSSTQIAQLVKYIISDFQPINAKLRHLIFFNGVDGVFTIEFTNDFL